jgi:hypothetical protein
VRALLVAAALGAATLGACGKARPVPLSVHLQGVPRILRVPPELVRTTSAPDSPVLAVAPGLADAFYGITAPQLERWGSTSGSSWSPRTSRPSCYAKPVRHARRAGRHPRRWAALGLSGLTPAADAELRAATQVPQFAWMAAEVNAWPRDPELHGATPPSVAAVRGRVRSAALTSRTEYLLGAERSARAAMFRVKVLQTRWMTDALPGGDGTFARRTLANGRELSNDQVLDLVTVSYHRGPAWTRRAVERLGPTWVARLAELGPEGTAAAEYLERVRYYTRLLGGDPQCTPRRPPVGRRRSG